jgi:peptidoglycan/LPS O-acetylase OafA/YrhL
LQFTQQTTVTDISPRNNFDLLRLFLAFSVCFAHLGEVSGVSAFLPLADYFYSGIAVDCFFVVSGFLIFRSFDRSSSIFSYLNKRVRRIYPAYLTVVLAAALLLPLLFSNAVTDILFSQEWLRYLFSNLAFLNFLQPDINGIFSSNPLQVINPPLWTIKVEVMFYLSVPLVFLLLKGKRQWLPLCCLYAASIAYSFWFLAMHASTGLDIYLKFEKQLPGQLSFFLSGGGLYLYYSLFKKYWKFFLIGATAILILSSQNSIIAQLFYPISLAILVIFVALIFPYVGNWGKFGDMSYGVYIYHFPIIQIFTTLSLFETRPWLAFSALLATILVTSFLSYRYIERPFLKCSSHYRQAEKSGD